jgi:4-amino-4-deoxy-L-arabinose transferase-like glycosyltransferase
LCGTAAAWGVLAFLFVPGTLPRYLIPVLPPAAVLVAAALVRLDRTWRAAWPWIALAAGWVVAAPLVARRELAALPPRDALLHAGSEAVVGALAVAVGNATARRFGIATAALLTGGLLYGVAFAGITEPAAGLPAPVVRGLRGVARPASARSTRSSRRGTTAASFGRSPIG